MLDFQQILIWFVIEQNQFINRQYTSFKQQISMFQQILQIAKKHQVDSTLIAQETSIIQAKKSPNNSISVVSNFSLVGSCGIEINNKQFIEFKTEVQKQYEKKQINVDPLNLIKFLRIGDQFPLSLTLNKVQGQQKADFEVNPTQISLFIIWKRQRPKFLSIINEIFSKNEMLWNEKVKISTLCITNDILGLKQYIKAQNLGKMQHFYIRQQQATIFLQKFGSFETPYACLIDTDRKVNFSGKNDRIDFILEDRINQLLKPDQPEIKQQVQQQNPSKQTIQKINMLLNRPQFQKWSQKCSRLNFWFRTIKLISKGKISIKCRIQVAVYEKDKIILDQLKKQIGSFDGVEYQEKIIGQVTIPEGKECSFCFKQLGQFYYWCYWNGTDSLGCRECVEAVNEQGHYKFCQNSILINKENKTILTKDIGNNLQPSNQQKALTPRYQCNICARVPRQRIGRYVALNANHHFERQSDLLDICQDCMTKHISKEKEQDLNLNMEEVGYLRILYQVKNYFQY